MHGYIVKVIDSGAVVVVIPDQHKDKAGSKERAEQFIKKNILLRKCEKWGNESMIEFAIRLDELADELFRGKKNPDTD